MNNQIQNKIDEVQNTLESFGLAKFGFSVAINTLKPGQAGCANTFWNKIILSADYIKEFADQVINVTLPHEICHLYINKYFPRAKQHHGPEFRRLMNLLGLDGKTYHTMQLANPTRKTKTKTRYVYIAEKSNTLVNLTLGQHQKMVSGASSFTLKTTGEKLKFTGEIKKIQ